MSSLVRRLRSLRGVIPVTAVVLTGTPWSLGSASAQSPVAIPSTPPVIERLGSLVQRPDHIDAASNQLGIPASLLNVHVATPADLSSIGLGRGIYIPVQISSREGGRKSLYFLNLGEEVLAGIFVNSDGVALRFVRRVSGRAAPAQTGDTYLERITSRDGKPVFEGLGRLEVLDASRGFGRLIFDRTPDGRPLRAPRTEVWLYWSYIRLILD